MNYKDGRQTPQNRNTVFSSTQTCGGRWGAWLGAAARSSLAVHTPVHSLPPAAALAVPSPGFRNQNSCSSYGMLTRGQREMRRPELGLLSPRVSGHGLGQRSHSPRLQGANMPKVRVSRERTPHGRGGAPSAEHLSHPHTELRAPGPLCIPPQSEPPFYR